MKGVEVPVETIRDSVDALFVQIDTNLSGYNKRSVISRFNAGEKVPATPMFLEMYRQAYAQWKRSEGALDCAAGPLFDAWGFGFKNSAFPTDEEVAALRSTCGMGLLPEEMPVEDGMVDPAAMGFPRLNYNAIAQGYSCDVIAAYLHRLGVKDMLVDIGEIWCEGVNPSGAPWQVGVDRPVDQPDGEPAGGEGLSGIWQSDKAPAGIVTSGNYRKFYIRDGRKYAHTIDPVTGYPVDHNLLSATVVSSVSAADADAVATWCMVIGLEKARALLQAEPTLEGYLVFQNEAGEMEEWASPGFRLKEE
jgi:thiamine biosynthesis lipoprotein